MTKPSKPGKQIPEMLEQALMAFNENGFAAIEISSIQRKSISEFPEWIDGEIRINTGDGLTYHLYVELKQHVDRRSAIDTVKMQTSRLADDTLLVTPYMTRQLAEYCKRLKLQFIDTAGNAYIDLPGFFVFISGKPRPINSQYSSQAVITPSRIKILFSFLQYPELVTDTYRAIAELSGVALGTIGPTIQHLTEKGYLTGKSRQRRLLNHEELLNEWITHYHSTLRPKLSRGRFSAGRPVSWEKADLPVASAWWSGEVAASHLTGYLHPDRAVIYVAGPLSPLVKAHHLRADEHGEIEILEAFWNTSKQPTADYTHGIAPPLVVYADLLGTGIDRNLDAARIIRKQYLSDA